MSKHNNPSISERARRIFNNQLNEEISNEVLDYITPTIEILPRCNVVESKTSTGTIYTTPTDKDFYLTNVAVNTTSINATTANSTLTITINGVNKIVLGVRSYSTATFCSACANSLNFKYPLKIDRGTNLTATFSDNGYINIIGYTEEVKNPSIM